MTARATFTKAELKRAATVARELGFCVVVRKDEIRLEPQSNEIAVDEKAEPKQW